MTEREQFEKAFPVPKNVYWNDELGYYDEYERDWDRREDEYQNAALHGWQAARAASPKVPQGVEEWLVGCEHCATIENNVLAFNMASNLRAYLSGMAIVPVDGFVIQKGSDEYNEIVVTGPDLGMQTFWPDDAAYGLMKAMLVATKENGE